MNRLPCLFLAFLIACSGDEDTTDDPGTSAGASGQGAAGTVGASGKGGAGGLGGKSSGGSSGASGGSAGGGQAGAGGAQAGAAGVAAGGSGAGTAGKGGSSGGAGATAGSGGSTGGGGGSDAGQGGASGQGGSSAGGQAGQGGSGQGGSAQAGSAQAGSSQAGGGQAGSAGSGQSGQGGGGAAEPSAGCGKPLTEETKKWLAKTVEVGGATREYFVYLPEGYDAQTPYSIVYQFHGCSDSAAKENNNVPLQNVAVGEAILVRGRAVGKCWDTASGGPDVAFFDAMVSKVEGGYCANTERRFVSGYSSGAYMTQRLACERGGLLRGVASIAGGVAGSKCAQPVAALLIHDKDDPTVKLPEGVKARDLYLAQNKCGATTVPQEPSPCVRYQGCDEGLPVVWCQTEGKKHDRQDSLASKAFWGFFSGL